MSPLPSTEKLFAIILAQQAVVAAGLDPKMVAQRVVAQALELTHAMGSVLELAEGNDMVYHAGSGVGSNYLGTRIHRSQSMSGMCVNAGIALTCDDAESDPRVNREGCRKVGIRSMICVPLFHNRDCFGVLKVFSDIPNFFKAEDVMVLELISGLIAASMSHAAQKPASLVPLHSSPSTRDKRCGGRAT